MRSLLTVLSLAVVLSSAACSKSGGGASPSASASASPSPSSAPAPLGPPPTIGVPVCDEYFAAYYACAAKMPAEGQKQFIDELQTNLPGWRGLAVRPDNRAQLEKDCQRSLAALQSTPLCREAAR
jgi:hypothetical protein